VEEVSPGDAGDDRGQEGGHVGAEVGGDAHLGCGRSVASGTEAPDIICQQIWCVKRTSGSTKRRCNRKATTMR
jgi:hypothetical protein